ncbi:MAG: hypothetical protein FWF82_01225 [Oscillospiraceae bacterium]|nr:hypothetical protein [Oscillospiraceae bacterium]
MKKITSILIIAAITLSIFSATTVSALLPNPFCPEHHVYYNECGCDCICSVCGEVRNPALYICHNNCCPVCDNGGSFYLDCAHCGGKGISYVQCMICAHKDNVGTLWFMETTPVTTATTPPVTVAPPAEYTIDDALEILRCLAKLPSVYDNVEIKPTINNALNILRVLAKLDLD